MNLKPPLSTVRRFALHSDCRSRESDIFQTKPDWRMYSSNEFSVHRTRSELVWSKMRKVCITSTWPSAPAFAVLHYLLLYPLPGSLYPAVRVLLLLITFCISIAMEEESQTKFLRPSRKKVLVARFLLVFQLYEAWHSNLNQLRMANGIHSGRWHHLNEHVSNLIKFGSSRTWSSWRCALENKSSSLVEST